MTVRRLLGIGAVVALAVGLIGYHVLFGYVVTESVANGIVVLQRKNFFRQIGANVTVFSQSGDALVVDSQLRPLAASTRREAERVADGRIKAVVVTHWHPDHSGGIGAYTNDTDVFAHENVKQRLEEPQVGFGLTKPGSRHEFPARDSGGLPNNALGVRHDLRIGESAIAVVHYPRAHTDGDVVVFIHDSATIVVGDLIWPDSFPFVDVKNGGSAAGLEAALRGVIAAATSDYHIIPGHGSSLGYSEALTYLDMVSETRAWVEAELASGQSIQKIAETGLPAEWDQWSSALVPAAVWIQMIYESR